MIKSQKSDTQRSSSYTASRLRFTAETFLSHGCSRDLVFGGLHFKLEGECHTAKYSRDDTGRVVLLST